jgi:serine acetyltransferase
VFARLTRRLSAARKPIEAWKQDVARVADAAARSGSKHPTRAALADASVWALGMIRGAAALRAATGTSFGLPQITRVVFHIDVWSDDIAGGLRLPHPFGIVIGEGASIGEGCTLMHNVTVQRGEGTRIDPGVVLGTGSVVLVGASIGRGALIGAQSVVRGPIPAGSVAVGAPARVKRALRAEELSS